MVATHPGVQDHPAALAGDEDNRPLVVIFICSDDRFDGDGRRIAELKHYYEARGFRVFFVRVAGTAHWLADPAEAERLMHMARVFLRKSVLVVVEAHLSCLGHRDKFLEDYGLELPDDEERGIAERDLNEGAKRLISELRRLGNARAEITTILNTMKGIVRQGTYLAN